MPHPKPLRQAAVRICIGMLVPALVCFPWAAWGPALASGAPAEPSGSVLHLIETVKRVKKSDPDKQVLLTPEEVRRNADLTGRINRMLDIPFISEYALLDRWNALDPKGRALFVDIFGELLAEVAYPNAGKFLQDLEVSVRKEKVIGQKAMVYTSVIHKEEGRIDIDFKLARSSDAWSVVDVYLDGVSLARNLRTQCLKIIREHSFEELILRMRKKIAEKDTAQLKEVTGKNP